MRSSLLALASLVSFAVTAQTTLYTETFESAPAFALNTNDASSAPGLANTWVINNVYAGATFLGDCLGLEFDVPIPTTPSQPGSITSPNGQYLHTVSTLAQANGALCCSFGAADGLCTDPDDVFARMTTDVSTVGYSDVSFTFWWLCNGGQQNYGQLYYSTNGGADWTQITTPISNYRSQPNWLEQTVSLPAFGEQSMLRFGFRFHNGTSLFGGAADPGFAVDELRIIAAAAVPNSISTGALGGTTFCQGASIQVPYTALGSYAAGNVFSAQLSDAVGSFASPTVIGTLTSTSSGSIACIIPALTPVGMGYRIRVVADQPATTGTAAAVDIAIVAAPFAGDDDLVTICKNSGVYDLMDFIPGASVCGSWTGPGGAFSGQFNSNSDNPGNYVYMTNCPGGCPQDAATIAIVLQDPANAGNDVVEGLCSDDPPATLVSYVDGGDLTGFFWYNGTTNPPDLSVPGAYDLIYVVYGTAPCENDTADFEFQVNAAADAGTNSTVTLCAIDPPTVLFDLLGGTPQPGGSWTGPSGPSTGVFVPGSSMPGLYTYTVAGVAPCGDAQAFIAVLVDPCQGIAERPSAHGLAWLGQEGEAHTIRIGDAIVTVFEVLDMQGRVVMRIQGPFGAGVTRFTLAELPAGTYTLRSNGGAALRIVHR